MMSLREARLERWETRILAGENASDSRRRFTRVFSRVIFSTRYVKSRQAARTFLSGRRISVLCADYNGLEAP